jgi:hypothetical protein
VIKFYWSRLPGKFVNKTICETFMLAEGLNAESKFTGTVREWYETLVETCIDAHNTAIHKGLASSEWKPNSIELLVGPDVHTMLEASVLYRSDGRLGAHFTVKKDKGLTNRVIMRHRGEVIGDVTVLDLPCR